MSEQRKVKVLFLFSSLGFGGTDLRIATLARHLDATRFESYLNCYHHVIDPRYDLSQFRYCDIRFGRIRSLAFLRAFARYARLVRELPIDVVQASFYEESFLAGMLQHYTGVASVYHKVDQLGPPRGITNRIALRYRNRHMDHVVANSDAVREWLGRIEGVSRDRTEVIYNGVDLERFRPAGETQKKTARVELGLPEDHLTIGVTANLRSYKGIDNLVAAVAQVVRREGGVSLVIIGDGPCRAEIEKQVCQLGLGGHVHFLGSREDVPSVLAACDVGALTSRTEGFPNAILEYMAAGLPTTATDVGGIPEVLVDGETGFLVPAGDVEAIANRLSRLLGNAALRSEMGRRARTVVEESFSVAAMSAEYAGLYERAAETARARMRR
jgi:glycosyltransferase involved in cell wall biosynthesis